VDGGSHGRAEDQAGEDVAGVVGADVDAGHGHQQRQPGGETGESAVDEPQASGHGSGDGGVVAREREVARPRHQHSHSGQRVVRAGPTDAVSDQLGGAQREEHRGDRAGHGGHGRRVWSLAGQQPRDDQRGDEDHDAVFGEGDDRLV
jgi:hypothetical protein